MNQPNLLQAYANTDYHVDGFDTPIRIGEQHPAIDAFCTARGFSTWAFITAWNPLSLSLPLSGNEDRNRQLRAELRDYAIRPGRGQSRSGPWPAEESFWVAGIDQPSAVDLAIKYGQRAIVTGQIHQEATLLETLDFSGHRELLLRPNIRLSGYHHPAEKAAVHQCLQQRQSLILVFAPLLPLQLPTALNTPMEEGRLLLLSPCLASAQAPLQRRDELIRLLAETLKP